MNKDYIPVVIRGEQKGDYLMELEFDNGMTKIVDLEQWLIAGGTVAWPDGADSAPETLLAAETVSSAA
ncbi:MAG: hypothetical protein D6743_07680 [Calditrichaeota bacterium]|nr:MAG: hypothetical protein D6743_07680 [Calditrichota bacterium]